MIDHREQAIKKLEARLEAAEKVCEIVYASIDNEMSDAIFDAIQLWEKQRRLE